MSIAQSFAAELDQEIPGVRKHLERIPQDKLDWRPHEKSFTAGHLANHIVNILDWLKMTAEDDSFDLEPTDAEPWKPPVRESVAELLEDFDAKTVTAREALTGVSDAAMQETWSLLKGGETVLAMPRVACIRSMILNHLVHHRAQLGVYLRLLDVAVPGVYGPSADDAS